MDQAERLKIARIAARYGSATEAASAMGVPYSTYSAHENGEKGLSRSGARYARFFRVSLAWLLSGEGEMTGANRTIPIMGAVGAGAEVEEIGDTSAFDAVGEIELPDPEHLGALVVRGDSQWPKWINGDLVIYDRRPQKPSEQVNKYSIIETVDGSRMIKMLRRSPKTGFWRIESHNAEPRDVELMAAYRYVLTLAR